MPPFAIGLPLLARIPAPPADGFSIGPLNIRLYGLLIAIGAFLALQMTVRRYERLGGDAREAERIALWVLGLGFVGARIGYVLPRLDQYANDPLGVFAIWRGGIVLFGGLFAGAVTAFVLVRRARGDFPAFADAIAPALPLAQAIGRWGNYFNQELYGRPTDLPWGLQVSGGDPRFPGATTFHPTFLYESLANAILVWLLLRIDRTGRLRKGGLIFVYAMGYGVIRTVVEALRVDTDFRLAGLSRNNWIAIAVAFVGLVGLRRWQTRPLTPEEAAAQKASGATAATDATDESGDAVDAPTHDPDRPDDIQADIQDGPSESAIATAEGTATSTSAADEQDDSEVGPTNDPTAVTDAPDEQDEDEAGPTEGPIARADGVNEPTEARDGSASDGETSREA